MVLGGFAGAGFVLTHNPSSVISGDFNEDGHLDLAVANCDYPPDDIWILLGDGLGGFATAMIYPAGINARSVTSGDFDNDGHSDLVVANSGSNTLSTFLGDGLGGFMAAVNFCGGEFPSLCHIGRF